MAFLVANSYLGLAKEATRGTLPTGATPYWIPVTGPQVSPMQTFLRDEALRGSPVSVYDMVAGVRHDEYDHKSYLFVDTFPVYMAALLGGADSPTPAGGYYTHTIGLLNNAATGSQPASYSICDFDGANYFVMTGAQASDATITFGAEVAADVAVKWIANPYVDATTSAAPFTSLALGTNSLIPSWETNIQIASSILNYISSGEIKIDRKTAPIFTVGQQAPYTNFAGPIEVTGKFTAVVDTNADPFSTGSGAWALFRNQLDMVINLVDSTNSSQGIQIDMAATQFQNVKRTRGKDYTELEVEFEAIANTADAITGYSPIVATISNTISSAY